MSDKPSAIGYAITAAILLVVGACTPDPYCFIAYVPAIGAVMAAVWFAVGALDSQQRP